MCKRSSSAGRCVCIAIAGVRCVSCSVAQCRVGSPEKRSVKLQKKKSNLEHRPGNFQSQTARLRLVNDEFAIFLDHPRLAFVCKFLSLTGVLRNRRNSTFGNTIPKGLSALLRLFWNLKPSVSSQEISSKFIVNHHWSWCDHGVITITVTNVTTIWFEWIARTRSFNVMKCHILRVITRLWSRLWMIKVIDWFMNQVITCKQVLIRKWLRSFAFQKDTHLREFPSFNEIHCQQLESFYIGIYTWIYHKCFLLTRLLAFGYLGNPNVYHTFQVFLLRTWSELLSVIITTSIPLVWY